MTSFAFNGSIELQLVFGAFGARVVRKARLDYEYEPDWPFCDVRSGEERVGSIQLKMKLSILALPRPRSSAGRQPVRRYWASADQLLSDGVLSGRLHDQFRCLVDAKARDTDGRNRLRAGRPAPPIPEQI